MSAHLLKGPRALLAFLGALVPTAPCLASGCGGSATTIAPHNDASLGPDTGLIPLTMVVTQGGGVSNGADGAPTDPFDPTDSGSSSSSSGASTSSSSGGSSGSSGATSGGSSSGSSSSGASSGSSGGTDGGPDAPPACPGQTPVMCGTTSCGLVSNTCCITFTLQGRCIPGNNQACHSNEARIACANDCDCPTGESCCGVLNTILGAVQTQCQTVPNGGNCQPNPPTNTQASAQICQVDAECKNGQPCVYQTCEYGAKLYMCGLQPAPFGGNNMACTAN